MLGCRPDGLLLVVIFNFSPGGGLTVGNLRVEHLAFMRMRTMIASCVNHSN